MTRAQRATLAELTLTALRDPAADAALTALVRVLASADMVEVEATVATRLRSMGLIVVHEIENAKGSGDGPVAVHATLAPGFAAARASARDRLRRARLACDLYRRRGTEPQGRDTQPGDPPDLAAALRRAAALFDVGLYFEVHEELETIWGRAAGETRLVLQGLIQIAVALHHGERGNLDGARRLLVKARAKLEPRAPTWRGIALGALLADLQRLEAAGFRGGEPPARLTVA